MLKKIFLSLNTTIPVGMVWLMLSVGVIIISQVQSQWVSSLFGINLANTIRTGAFLSLWLSIIYMIFPIVPGLLSLIGSPPYHFLGKGKRAQAVLKNGHAATATVLEISESAAGAGYAMNIGADPYVSLKLRIEGFRQPYEVNLSTLIPRLHLPSFQPGARFQVKVDPKNPNDVVLAGG